MASKRDYIKEILDKRARVEDTERLGAPYDRFELIYIALDFVLNEMDKNDPTREELLKYFPIGIVACIESYFRLVFRDLINFGSPYSERANKLTEYRFKLSDVLAIKNDRVSIGEIVSHLLTINQFSDIEKIMTCLLDEDFYEQLKEIKYPVDLKDPEKKETIESQAPRLKKYLSKAFSLRHIFCHETPNSLILSENTLEHLRASTLLLIYLTEELLEVLLQK